MGSFDPQPHVERIWKQVGYEPPFPRDLLLPAMEAFPITVIVLPHLKLSTINQWLRARSCAGSGEHADRHLSGCLVARKGHGLIFIEQTLPPQERRFALAHELAHFVTHYLAPREAAIAHYGPQIISVLDGDRRATPAERLSGLLHGVQLGSFEDFLGRNSHQHPNDDVLDLETQADMVAIELLAPKREIRRLARAGQNTVELLGEHFGLPHWAAVQCARTISGYRTSRESFIQRIEAVIKNKN